MCTLEKHKENLKKALKSLYEHDFHLLEININERTLSARIAHYLTQYYQDHNVDCEYNRFGPAIKRLPAATNTSTDNIDGKTIFPDIIIHRRGQQNDNQIVIEIKKETNTHHEDDIKKLKALTSDEQGYSYNYGFHLTLAKQSAKITIYENGQEKEPETVWDDLIRAY